MIINRNRLLASAGAFLALPGIAMAQTATPNSGATPSGSAANAAAGTAISSDAKLSQGATVYDTTGTTVGTIESIDGDFAVLATSKNKVRLPKTSFAQGDKGPIIGMSAAQLDAAASQAAGAQAGASASGTPAKANVVKGAAVADTQGGAVGTIADVDAQFATVTLTTGAKVRLPVTAFGAGADGGLRVAMTAAQLSAAAGAAKGG